MRNNLTKCFWGPVDGDQFLNDAKELIKPFGLHGAFAGDNLIVFGKNLGFLDDEDFKAAFTRHIHEENYVGYGIMWRLYMFSWAAKTCLRRNGDFVECGVSSGTSSIIMCDYLRFQNVEKTLYLYDAWGMDSRVQSSAYGFSSDTMREVTDRFSRFSNVKIVPGFVPESFAEVKPQSIAFLHIDLNNADAEIAVLDHLYERVVPGGIVLFDDYGAQGYRESQVAEDAWAARNGVNIAELPTGQGLLIK